MTDKLDPYDVLTKLVLGILLVCAILVTFPAISMASEIKIPTAFTTLALVAAALFTGEVLQAISSMTQSILYFTFGGRPSDGVLDTGLKGYVSQSAANRVRSKLAATVGANASERDLFQYAMQLSQASGRVAKFNAQYGYHRGMLTMVFLWLLLFLGSIRYGAALAYSKEVHWTVIAGLVVLIVILWYRAKQWACYYTKEVVYTAEQLIDSNSKSGRKEEAERSHPGTEEKEEGGGDDEESPEPDDSNDSGDDTADDDDGSADNS